MKALDVFRNAEKTFWGHLGCRVESVSQQKVEIALEIQDHHLNSLGILHGGVYASMLDSAMGLLAMYAKQNAKIVTTNLNIHYVSPIRAGQIRVNTSLLHESAKTITAQGIATGDDGAVLAIGTGSFRILG